MNQSKPRVLVVDDDPTSISILADILQEQYDISIALNGQQALRVMSKGSDLDLVLLDVKMPDIDGYEICQQLKEKKETQDIPVIFITASNSYIDEQRGLELGAVDYITKPFRPAIIKARIKNHLELKHQRDLLKYLSLHDALTSIANRARFDIYLQDEWQHALRLQLPLSLIMIDIDKFKQFNDYYGHVAGDECLKQIASVIKESLVRSTDLVARYGGEEFGCILPMTDKEGAFQLAEKIREQIYRLGIVHEKSLETGVVTVSLGVTTLVPSFKSNISEFINSADRRLYQAKEEGRNQVVNDDL